MEIHSIGTPTLWITFIGAVLILLTLDLTVFHRKAHVLSFKEAIGWTTFWVSLAMAFNAFIYWQFGSQRALEFFTGFVIEQSLSIDNVFIFLVIFSAFRVPPLLRHKVLFWGILGAIVFRIVFILLGTALLQRFHWFMYVFGAILVFTAFKMFMAEEDDDVDPRKNPIVRLFKRLVPLIDEYRDGKFFDRENGHGRRKATLLLLVVCVMEATDIVFAVDSIPAIFAITTDPYLVFTSNIFAILGLRSLFFVVAGFIDKFHYLNMGLAFVLAFVGIKMLIVEFYKIPTPISLGVIAFFIGSAIVASFIRSKRLEKSGGSSK